MRPIRISSFFRNAFFRLSDVGKQEQLAVGCTVAVLLFIPLGVWWYETQHIPAGYPEGAKIFTLTGVASEGTWTVQEVAGYNYWWKSFPRATVSVDQGDVVVLRLKSPDVTHVFYAPSLGIAPVTVEPGHVKEIIFRADASGGHPYYCLSVCGECHFFMQGEIVVGERDASKSASYKTQPACIHLGAAPESSSLYERGEFLFRKMGCIACHGEGGQGGVPNPNYVKGTVPALNNLARTLSLVDEEATKEFLKLIEQAKSLDEMAELDVDIPRLRLVLAKYGIVRDVIQEGRSAARADTTSFDPPLEMPSWHARLSDRDIDAIIVYLLRQPSWKSSEE